MAEAIAYIRCSTQEQVDSGLGLEAQTERIRAYCCLKGLELAEIVTDAGVSGGKPLAKRDGGQALLLAVKRRKIRAIVMFKLDRGFRNAGDCLTTVDHWERSGVSLHIVDLGGNAIDTKSAAGRFMLVVLAGAAEMERNLVRERTRAALAVKRANGQRVSRSQYGCDLALDGKTLVENRAEQAIIGNILDMRGAGMSFEKIADALTKRGVPTKHGKARWHQATINGLVRQHERQDG